MRSASPHPMIAISRQPGRFCVRPSMCSSRSRRFFASGSWTSSSPSERNGVLAKVVYHKLADPDHKKLRTLVADGVLRHVNNGYCSLLEPRQISGSQFAEWITGRNPGTYVAAHYVKLIDFSFADCGLRIAASGL